MFSAIKSLGNKLDQAIREVNSPHWSLTKLGIMVFLYPTITFVFVYDAYKNNRMDWMNTAVYICGIVTPRLVSQILAARFGYQGKNGERLDGDNSIDASPKKPEKEDE
jgi:hypothetical protein